MKLAATESPHPIVLSPATPSEFLDRILSRLRHPSTILICWPRSVFLAALVEDVKHGLSLSTSHHDLGEDPTCNEDLDRDPPRVDRQVPSSSPPPPPPPPPPLPPCHTHPLLHATLLQRATSRHLRLAFVPSVAHLRAYLATFSHQDPASSVDPPPSPSPSPSPSAQPCPLPPEPHSSSTSSPRPALLVYGLLELHRDGSEWSARGLGISSAALVEAAARSRLRPVLVEPRGAMGFDALDDFLGEELPVLSGMMLGEDETAWRRRSVPVKRVLSRWFHFEEASPGNQQS